MWQRVRHIPRALLGAACLQVVLAYGAESDKKLGIPGEVCFLGGEGGQRAEADVNFCLQKAHARAAACFLLMRGWQQVCQGTSFKLQKLFMVWQRGFQGLTAGTGASLALFPSSLLH